MMQRWAAVIQADTRITPRNVSLKIGGRPAFVNGDGSVTNCDISKPQIGCLRVSWRRSTTEVLSVVADLDQVRLRALEGHKVEHGHEEDMEFRTMPWRAPATLMCPAGEVDLLE